MLLDHVGERAFSPQSDSDVQPLSHILSVVLAQLTCSKFRTNCLLNFILCN